MQYTYMLIYSSTLTSTSSILCVLHPLSTKIWSNTNFCTARLSSHLRNLKRALNIISKPEQGTRIFENTDIPNSDFHRFSLQPRPTVSHGVWNTGQEIINYLISTHLTWNGLWYTVDRRRDLQDSLLAQLPGFRRSPKIQPNYKLLLLLSEYLPNIFSIPVSSSKTKCLASGQ